MSEKNDDVEVVEKEGGEQTPEEKSIDDMSTEELKAHAEKLEAGNKESKEKQSEDEIKSNYKRRIEKATAKGEKTTPEAKAPEVGMDTDDIVTLRLNKFAKDSKQAEVLKRYKDGGIITDYESGLTHVAVKAELDAIEASENAATVIGENDSAETQIKTKKEAIANYRKSGNLPGDKDMQKAISDDNLEKMGL